MGRYDNVALYLEGNHGKIGLIDLEKFSSKCKKKVNGWCYSKCQNAVCLFPYHLEEIIIVARTFDPNIDTYRQYLENVRDGALKRFKLAYLDHSNFIKEKGITPQNPTVFAQLEDVRLEQIKVALGIVLRKEHDDTMINGCLDENPEATLTIFNEKSFPKIMEAIYTFINDLLEINMKSYGGQECPSIPRLLSIRTLQFTMGHVPYYRFKENIRNELEVFNLSVLGMSALPDLLLHSILIEFVKGREIAYYNPSFGYDGYTTRCIFC